MGKHRGSVAVFPNVLKVVVFSLATQESYRNSVNALSTRCDLAPALRHGLATCHALRPLMPSKVETHSPGRYVTSVM